MKTEFACIPCAINSYLRLCETGVVKEEDREGLLRKLLSLLSESSYEMSPPALGREIHRLIRQELKNPDPYKAIKVSFNKQMLDLVPELEKRVLDSEDSFNAALRLAIAGNVIDFGAKYQYDILEAIDRIMVSDLALDDSEKLKEAIANAQSLMYIGDNCGEIVMDKLFLQYMDVPKKYFVVRGAPIINDITTDDAEYVQMEEVASIITTGDDSPGAVWESSSEEFRTLFDQVDVVISKGQGNLEGLLDIRHKNIYFLLVTKCELIADKLGVEKGNYIVSKGKTKTQPGVA